MARTANPTATETGARREARRGAPERPAGRPMVRTVGAGTRSLDVVFDVRPVYDFMISLSDDAGATDDLPASDREWLVAAREGLPGLAKRDREGLLGNEAFLGALVVVVDRPEIHTGTDLIEALREMAPRDLARQLMVDSVHHPEMTPLVEAALNGDESALPRIQEALKSKLDPDECALRVDLLRQPEEYHRRLLGVLEAWQVKYAEVEERVTAMIRRDADDRLVDRGSLSPVDLIERTTGGIRWIPEGPVSKVILAPIYFGRPYNYLFSGDDWRAFAYPIADSALDGRDPLAPPPAMIRLHRALGDETRLRILKLLTERDLYMTEIANELGLSKPTIKHHLVLLRSAGLVTVTEEGAVLYYSLRRDRLKEANQDIGRFLTA
jgi:DNA-binding transcriptional ArsR family regulator